MNFVENSRKIKRIGDPPPGVLVYRIARRQDRCQVLRINGQKLFRLRELRPRVVHNDRQNDLPETVPMGNDVLPGPIACPQDLKDCRLERFDGLVDE